MGLCMRDIFFRGACIVASHGIFGSVYNAYFRRCPSLYADDGAAAEIAKNKALTKQDHFDSEDTPGEDDSFV